YVALYNVTVYFIFYLIMLNGFFFFFQAEDGIRDYKVTGVQTCALPICQPSPDSSGLWNRATVGVVSVSDSRDYLDGLMKNVERQAMRIANNAGAEVTDSFVEFL